jgi:hypothetical protein
MAAASVDRSTDVTSVETAPLTRAWALAARVERTVP